MRASFLCVSLGLLFALESRARAEDCACIVAAKTEADLVACVAQYTSGKGCAPIVSTCDAPHSLTDPLPDECLEPIDTDRPHQTDTPHVVPPGHIQVESALASVKLGQLGSGERTPRAVFFDNNYKAGLGHGMDLQVLWKHAEYSSAASAFTAPGPLQLRVKLNIVEEEGARPAITLVPWLVIPFSHADALRAGPLVFLGWELPHRFELEMNAGMFVSGKPKPVAALVLASALTYGVTEKFKVFVDAYTTGWDAALGTGLLYTLTRDAQVDAGTYIGLDGDEPVATPFIGLSIRR